MTLVALACVVWPTAAPSATPPAPAPPPSPGDVAATRGYLEAAQTELQAIVATLPTADADAADFVKTLDMECPNVLEGVQTEETIVLRPQSNAGQLAASRRNRQLRRIKSEALSALLIAWEVPERPALLAFAHSLSALQWSSPTLTAGVHAKAADIEERATEVFPAVCADMRTWVASGYSALPAGTQAFVRHMAAQSRQRKTLTPADAQLESLEHSDKQLLAQDAKLDNIVIKSLNTVVLRLNRELERDLGLQVASHPLAAPRERPPKHSVVIARGRKAGERYVARLERAPVRTSPACPLSLSISRPAGKGGFFLGDRETICLERSALRPQSSVDCTSGRLTITANTLSQARSVRLRLSNGRQITTPVLFVPKRLGGPAGYYYQVVRGPSPIPVSLTELNAQGLAVRTVRLARVVECTRNPLKYLPGGRRTLVHETAPNGPTFSIVSERYRFLGKVYFEVKLHVKEMPIEEGEFAGGFIESTGSTVLGRIVLGTRRPVVEPQVETGCRPQPYTIVYGLLRARGDTVLVGTPPATLAPLRKVTIPAYLHPGDVLVYAVLPGAPARLLVRAPGGRTVQDEPLEASPPGWVPRCEREATERRETAEEEA